MKKFVVSLFVSLFLVGCSTASDCCCHRDYQSHWHPDRCRVYWDCRVSCYRGYCRESCYVRFGCERRSCRVYRYYRDGELEREEWRCW